MGRLLAALSVVFPGCCYLPAPAPATTTVAPEGTSAAAPPPAGEARRTATRTVAAFVNDQLDECSEFTVVVTGPAGAELPDPETALAAFSPQSTAQQRVMLIDGPCESAFAGRLVMARCAFSRPVPEVGPTASLDARAAFYRFATALSDDSRMLECMGSGGRWEALAADSLEYQRAEADYHLDEARRRLGER